MPQQLAMTWNFPLHTIGVYCVKLSLLQARGGGEWGKGGCSPCEKIMGGGLAPLKLSIAVMESLA